MFCRDIWCLRSPVAIFLLVFCVAACENVKRQSLSGGELSQLLDETPILNNSFALGYIQGCYEGQFAEAFPTPPSLVRCVYHFLKTNSGAVNRPAPEVVADAIISVSKDANSIEFRWYRMPALELFEAQLQGRVSSYQRGFCLGVAESRDGGDYQLPVNASVDEIIFESLKRLGDNTRLRRELDAAEWVKLSLEVAWGKNPWNFWD